MDGLQPLADRILVKADEPDLTTPSGLVLVSSEAEGPQTATVAAAGVDVKELGEGDRVLYSKYGTTEISVDGVDLLVLREADVLVKLG